MLAEGASYNFIKLRLGTTAPTISRWKQRFLAAGLDGLDTSHPGQKPTVLTARLRLRILAATRKPPRDGSMYWCCCSYSGSPIGVERNRSGQVAFSSPGSPASDFCLLGWK